MVAEEDAIRIYYSVENSKIYHGSEPQFLEIDESMAPAVETLINMYPEFVTVEQLDIENDSDKLQVGRLMYKFYSNYSGIFLIFLHL